MQLNSQINIYKTGAISKTAKHYRPFSGWILAECYQFPQTSQNLKMSGEVDIGDYLARYVSCSGRLLNSRNCPKRKASRIYYGRGRCYCFLGYVRYRVRTSVAFDHFSVILNDTCNRHVLMVSNLLMGRI